MDVFEVRATFEIPRLCEGEACNPEDTVLLKIRQFETLKNRSKDFTPSTLPTIMFCFLYLFRFD